MYPYSSEHARYEHLLDVLSLYRLTLGQPRQEELAQIISSNHFPEEELRQLIINLSPYNRKETENIDPNGSTN
jgi:hypothetical protein